MNINVAMPQLGESVTEGEVTAWLKSKGDTVERDEALVEVKTDKATVEIPSPASGVVAEVLAEVGQTVRVGANIAVIRTTSAQAATAVESPAVTPREVAPAAPAGVSHETQPGARRTPSRQSTSVPPSSPTIRRVKESPAVRMTPLARRLAREMGLKTDGLVGTGAGGRITRDDLPAVAPPFSAAITPSEHPAPPPPPPKEVQRVPPPNVVAPQEAPLGAEDEAVPLTPMRRRIAARLLQSAQTIPQVTTAAEVDMTAVAELRTRRKADMEKTGLNLTFMPFFMTAALDALKAFPYVNSSWAGDKIILHKRVHLGIAVSVQSGLAVPVIHNADALSLRELCRSLTEIAAHARAGRLVAAETQGGTFTITNPGAFGAIHSTPLINPPEAAILGIYRIAETPSVREGRIVIRQMTTLCLSYDHRIVDGETAIKFLQHMKKSLEDAAFDLT